MRERAHISCISALIRLQSAPRSREREREKRKKCVTFTLFIYFRAFLLLLASPPLLLLLILPHFVPNAGDDFRFVSQLISSA